MATREQENSFAIEFDECVILTKGALDVAIEWFRGHLAPDDVFHKDQLDHWAKSNGYIKSLKE